MFSFLKCPGALSKWWLYPARTRCLIRVTLTTAILLALLGCALLAGTAPGVSAASGPAQGIPTLSIPTLAPTPLGALHDPEVNLYDLCHSTSPALRDYSDVNCVGDEYAAYKLVYDEADNLASVTVVVGNYRYNIRVGADGKYYFACVLPDGSLSAEVRLSRSQYESLLGHIDEIDAENNSFRKETQSFIADLSALVGGAAAGCIIGAIAGGAGLTLVLPGIGTVSGVVAGCLTGMGASVIVSGVALVVKNITKWVQHQWRIEEFRAAAAGVVASTTVNCVA